MDKEITRAARLGCVLGGTVVGLSTGNVYAAGLGCIGGALGAKEYQRRKIIKKLVR